MSKALKFLYHDILIKREKGKIKLPGYLCCWKHLQLTYIIYLIPESKGLLPEGQDPEDADLDLAISETLDLDRSS